MTVSGIGNTQHNPYIQQLLNKPTQPQSSSASSFELSKPTTSLPIGSNPVDEAISKAMLVYENPEIFSADDKRLFGLRGASEQDQTRFKEILGDAIQSGKIHDPIAYIKSLPPEDIDVLKRIHSSASAYTVRDVTTAESALNLLLPPSEAVDINDDGLVHRGRGFGLVFPPPNAPQEVKDAWAASLESAPPQDQLLSQVPFLTAHFSANVRVDETTGKFLGVVEPGDPDYTNPFPAADAGVDAWMDYLNGKVDEYRAATEFDPNQQVHLDRLSDFANQLADILTVFDEAET